MASPFRKASLDRTRYAGSCCVTVLRMPGSLIRAGYLRRRKLTWGCDLIVLILLVLSAVELVLPRLQSSFGLIGSCWSSVGVYLAVDLLPSFLRCNEISDYTRAENHTHWCPGSIRRGQHPIELQHACGQFVFMNQLTWQYAIRKLRHEGNGSQG